jgi:hypothetical protein
MPTYRVEWSIDVEADSPVEAAKQAQRMQQRERPDYWVGVFSVIEHDSDGVAVSVDLDEIEPDEIEETA